jgi:hypothetical protein
MTAMVSPLRPAGKPFESKKPYKKSGGNKGMVFMQTIFKAYAKS